MFSHLKTIGLLAALSTLWLTGCGSGAAMSPTTPTSDDPNAPLHALKWDEIASTRDVGVESAGGTIGGKMYIFGGYLNKVYRSRATAEMYDPQTDRWSTLPDVPHTVTHAATVENGRNFILAGGYSTDANDNPIYATDTVFNFNVDTQTWSELPKLPSPRGGGGMARIGNTLHYFSGIGLDRVEKHTHWTLNLDDLAGGWKTASTFPYPRTHFSTVADGTNIYIMGGLVGFDQDSSDFADAYKYDTVADKWTKLTDLPLPLSHTTDATVLYNNRIWLFGGERSYNDTQQTTLVYDIAKNEWTANTVIPELRFAADAVNINGTFYFARGSMDETTAWKATLT